MDCWRRARCPTYEARVGYGTVERVDRCICTYVQWICQSTASGIDGLLASGKMPDLRVLISDTRLSILEN